MSFDITKVDNAEVAVSPNDVVFIGVCVPKSTPVDLAYFMEDLHSEGQSNLSHA
jgi:hypothetical protein